MSSTTSKQNSGQIADEVDGAVPIAFIERRRHESCSIAQKSPTNEECSPPFNDSSGHGARPLSWSECSLSSASSDLFSSPDSGMDASNTNDTKSVGEDCPLCNAENTEYMVQVFLSTLKRNLNVKEILPYLHFISHNDAMALSETVPQELAVQRLIDIIMEIRVSQERGKWTTFLVALEKTGYTYLHQLLTGETEKDHFYTNEILKIMTPALVNDIHLDAIIDKLIETGLINEEDHDQIKSAQKSKGLIAATRVFLQKVDKRKTNWDTEFADVLNEAGLTQIASVFKMVEHHTHKDNPKSKPPNRKLSKCSTANRKCSIHNEGHLETALCMRKTLTENPDFSISDRNKTASLAEQVEEMKQDLMDVKKALTSLNAEQKALLLQIDAKMKTVTDCLSFIQEDILSRIQVASTSKIQHDVQERQTDL